MSDIKPLSSKLPVTKKKHKIPNKWIGCPSLCSMTIADIFIVFKTPLDFKFKQHSINRFNTNMVFSKMAEKNINIGLWIDLTNTNKYYDKLKVESMKCTYVKIANEGGKLPTSETVKDFVNICSNFIENNPLKKIGVHCTHGFNRTGFMIVTYLIEKLNYSVPNALAYFAAARPPGIYRQHFISELYYRYSD